MIANVLSKPGVGVTLAALVLTAPMAAKEMAGRHHAGDRTGLHGMALFGNTVHYLAHIPMMQRPHNEQFIMRVNLTSADGAELDADFSATAHSIRPTQTLSLDDLVVGAVESFTADVFAGNFEHQAPRIHTGVTLEIEEVLVARNLAEDVVDSSDPLFYLIGEDESWLLNVISGARNRQEIISARVLGSAPGLSDTFALRVSVVQAEDGAMALLDKAGVSSDDGAPLEPTRIPLELGPRIWCLDGPDFFEPCG